MLASHNKPPALAGDSITGPRRNTSRRLAHAAGATLLVVAASSACRAKDTEPTVVASVSQGPQELLPWPGTPIAKIPYPGRVKIPSDTCFTYSVKNPQPAIEKSHKLFTVTDGRRSVPPDCNPETDIGVGTYTGASYRSPVLHRSDGSTHIPDGTVVEVKQYALGQTACNDGGGNNVWVGVQETPGGTEEWAWVGNFGGAPTVATMKLDHIPQVDAVAYATSAPAGGC